MPGPALLERIDRAIAELLELRAEVSHGLCETGADERGMDTIHTLADDLSPKHLLDTHAAQERFGYPQDTIRKWCRTEGLGVMQGGRWLVSVPRLQRRINGK